jgi:hypothetical protein
VSTEMFSSNGCYTVACLHSSYMAMGLHVTILSPRMGGRNVNKVHLLLEREYVKPRVGSLMDAASTELRNTPWKRVGEWRFRSVTTRFFQKVSDYIFSRGKYGERVGKLSVVVEGTFMRMRDFLLPRNTVVCVCRCQRAKWCNTCSSHSRFAQGAQDDRTLGAAILQCANTDPEFLKTAEDCHHW